MVWAMIRATAPSGTTRPAWAFAVAAMIALASHPNEAQANTRLCQQLEAQLVEAASPRSGRQAKRYDDAIARQRLQLQKAREDASTAGCGRAILGGNIAFCGTVNAAMQRMEANLATLQHERSRVGSAGRTNERSRLLAAIDANGCRSERRSLPPPIEQPSGQIVTDGRTGQRIGGLPGKFRTLCVRTCDGYYFPISYSVPQTAFERDGKACSAMCPGTEVELYYHRVPGEEPADMVSMVTGRPYGELASAFRYREPGARFPPTCGCTVAERAARGFEVIGGEYGETEAETVAVPAPAAPEPEPVEPSRSGKEKQDAESKAMDAGDRDVRVVGPRFLPDPEEAIDLRVQDPNRGP
jgi:hypothetical protein